jgi:hypothetical protein
VRVVVGAVCRHVRGSHVFPGWGCCKCSVYNGYQREACRNCGHPPCYPTDTREGREAADLKPIGHDPDAVRRWLAERDLSRSGRSDGEVD